MTTANILSQLGSAGVSTGFKNRIINGAMVIDQRNNGASVTLSNSGFVYGVDRWAGITGLASSSTITTQRVSINSNGFQYATRILRGSGTYTSTVAIIQEPESLNTYDLAGQIVTISYWARKGSSSTAIVPYIQLVSGTGTDQGISGAYSGSWTGWVSLGTSVPTLTTTLAQYTATFTIPSNATELAVLFSISGYSGTGSANDYIDITGVQLEVGTTATNFDYRPYGTELQLCQRYYETTSLPSATFNQSATRSSVISSANNNVGGNNCNFVVAKRAAPTVTLFSRNNTSGQVSLVSSGSDFSGSATANQINAMGFANILLANNATSGALIEAGYTANAEL
jgi:hypothetical protein